MAMGKCKACGQKEMLNSSGQCASCAKKATGKGGKKRK